MENMITLTFLAKASIVCAVLSALCLITLHFVSPEFDPSWRMVSEYATGKHKWLITWFFYLWGISTFLLSFLLWKNASGMWLILGVSLLFITGIGEIMGGAFDVKHKLHGMAFFLGVPFLPIASLIISSQLIKTEPWSMEKSTIIWSAHATWISLLIMAVAMIILMNGFKKAGIAMGPDIEPPSSLPDGVIAFSGYANRLLILTNLFWLVVLAKAFLARQV